MTVNINPSNRCNCGQGWAACARFDGRLVLRCLGSCEIVFEDTLQLQYMAPVSWPAVGLACSSNGRALGC